MTPSQTASSPQTRVNLDEWVTGRHLEVYANQILSPAEVRIFVAHRDALSGRVLDLGCGAGRILAYLAMLGADAHGLDLAPAMVEHARRAVPDADVRVGDVLALPDGVEGEFDAVLAVDNLLDALGHAERRAVVRSIRDVVRVGGLFVFSAHDLGWAEAHPGPRAWETRTGRETLAKLLDVSPAALARAVQRRRRAAANRRKLRPLEERHADWAVLNDFPHDYSLLHYYIRRDAQERQLQESGFELVECLDGSGRIVPAGGHAPADGEHDNLHYVARRVSGGLALRTAAKETAPRVVL